MTSEAERVHNESVIVDGLYCHLEQPIPPTDQIPNDMLLQHIVDSGLTAFNDTVFADSRPTSAEDALMAIYERNLIVETYPDKVIPIRTIDDVYTAKRTGKVGIIGGTQGLAAIGTNMRYIWVFYSLGIRVMQLTYNEDNALGSGCREPNDKGLTRFGQQAIEHMNSLGIILDLSHVGHRTSLDAIAYSKRPSIISHAGVKALCKHPRNVSDDQIKAVADSGGVVGVCPHSIMIERERGIRPTVYDFIDQISYVAELVGIDHVGVGTDNFQYDTYYSRVGRTNFELTYPGFFGGYDFNEKHVAGFSTWPEWSNLTKCLLERGFSAEDTSKVLGGNFVRVFGEVWR